MATQEFKVRFGAGQQYVQDGTAKVGTAVTTEEQLSVIGVKQPQGILGKNGSFKLTLKFTATNNANVKTLRARVAATAAAALTGTVLAAVAVTSLAGGVLVIEGHVRNDYTKALMSVTGTVEGAPAEVGSLALGSDFYISLTAQKATAGDTLQLEGYRLEFFHDTDGSAV